MTSGLTHLHQEAQMPSRFSRLPRLAVALVLAGLMLPLSSLAGPPRSVVAQETIEVVQVGLTNNYPNFPELMALFAQSEPNIKIVQAPQSGGSGSTVAQLKAQGANTEGALSRLLETSAANMDGNGQALHDTTRNLSRAVQTFSEGRGDLFSTVKNLNTFSETVAANDAQVRRLNGNLATVSTTLDAERDDLAAALANLAVALDEVTSFVKDNRAVLKDDGDSLHAGAWLDRAAMLMPGNPAALNNRALVHMERGELPQAREALHRVLAAGVVLAVLVAILRHSDQMSTELYWAGIMRWIHVFFGILWIGLLYYFNFVQIPSMPKIPDEHKPAIGKVIAPTALFFFRWAALGTVAFGLLTALHLGYLVQALTFQAGFVTIGIGMWLALIMAFNVWFVIWPNQKKALGLVDADADTKKKAARTAMLFSRTNTMLSIPMLYCMVAYQQGFTG